MVVINGLAPRMTLGMTCDRHNSRFFPIPEQAGEVVRKTVFFLCVLWMLSVLPIWAALGEEKPPQRSLDAVFHPDAFPPFSMVAHLNAPEFEWYWRSNPAWVLANLSHAAYHAENVIRELITRCGARFCRVYDVKGAFAFLAVWQDKAILAFRGTQAKTAEDLAADLLFLPTPYGSSTVHTGFLMEINKIWPKIELDLKREVPRKRGPVPVWVTGHSLGGALATLAGMRFGFEAVVTFGEPPVGRNMNKMFISKRHLRYVNGEDPISHLPEIFSDYFGNPIRIKNADGTTDWHFDHAISYYAENLFIPSRD